MTTASTTVKKWKKADIRSKLEVNDVWLVKGLLAIYAQQTPSEQESGFTAEDNGFGFNGVDAEFLTSLAVQYNQHGSLSPKQMGFARVKMLKYSGQLAKLANMKAQAQVDTLL